MTGEILYLRIVTNTTETYLSYQLMLNWGIGDCEANVDIAGGREDSSSSIRPKPRYPTTRFHKRPVLRGHCR
jgi:hypothetical protein